MNIEEMTVSFKKNHFQEKKGHSRKHAQMF